MNQINNKQGLSLMDSAMLIMGSMIGSGIFIVAADIARTVGSPGMLLLIWLVTGIMTVFGALSYGELAAAMPNAGGQYVYLREIYHPLFGFLYGWTVFTIIQTGTIAAVGVAFAKFAGVFFPSISAEHVLFNLPIPFLGDLPFSTQQLLAVILILGLTFSNFRNVKSSALLQNIFTITKITALAAIVILGLYAGIKGLGNSQNFHTEWPSVINMATIGIFCSAMVGSLFSADAWNNITYIAGEVNNPKKNLPLSMLLGTGTVMVIYFLVNVIYVYILPIEQIKHAEADRVGTLLMSTILGPSGLNMMAILVMISTFGCLNGIILSGARVYYAMAKDGLFFKQAEKLNNNHVPANSLTIQAIWACVLVLSGSYNQLLDYVIFAVLLFYILTVTGVFIHRIKFPNADRPYKTFGYPIVPAVYLILSIAITISLLVYKPTFSLRGLYMVLAGVPIYFLLIQKKQTN